MLYSAFSKLTAHNIVRNIDSIKQNCTPEIEFKFNNAKYGI